MSRSSLCIDTSSVRCRSRITLRGYAGNHERHPYAGPGHQARCATRRRAPCRRSAPSDQSAFRAGLFSARSSCRTSPIRDSDACSASRRAIRTRSLATINRRAVRCRVTSSAAGRGCRSPHCSILHPRARRAAKSAAPTIVSRRVENNDLAPSLVVSTCPTIHSRSCHVPVRPAAWAGAKPRRGVSAAPVGPDRVERHVLRVVFRLRFDAGYSANGGGTGCAGPRLIRSFNSLPGVK